MDGISVALVAIAVACFIAYRRFRKTSKRRPPVYPWIPVVGRFYCFIRNDKIVRLTDIPEYDVYRTNIGPVEFYMLNSYRAVNEAFVGQADIFSGRMQSEFTKVLTHNAGVGSIDGPVWQEHRRLMLRLLREFGLGRPVVASLIDEECAAMKETLDRSRGTPINTQDVFSSVTNNVIARLIFGERTGTDDEKFKEFAEHMKRTTEGDLLILIPMMFPWLLKVPILKRTFVYFSKIFYYTEKMNDYIRDKIEHQRRVLESMDPRPTELKEAINICEALLIEQAGQEAANPGKHTFTEWPLIRNMAELFAAGTDTTASTLNWATLLLAGNPEVQERTQREIEEKIGRQRPPTMADRQHVPYVCAVMDEVMRCSTLLPFNVIHRTTGDTELLGYHIPADAWIQCNLFGIYRDPRLWSHPNEMHPEHFLTSEGEYKPSKYLIPFSLGKRACLGESLARTEYFLAFVTLMQTFRVQVADPDADVKALANPGINDFIRRPLPHKIVFTRLDSSA